MTKNMGTIDRTLRLVLAVIIAVLYFTGRISGVAAIVLGAFALLFLVTSLVGWCPAYVPFGVSTRKGTPTPQPAAPKA